MSSPVNLSALTRYQAAALSALQAFGARMGWKGEAVVVEGDLVYQAPLPRDPHVSGAFFTVEPDTKNIRLYLTLPWNAAPSQRAEASEFVIRSGYGRRFGALEFNPDQGSLRVRIDTDSTDDALDDSIQRLLDRAMALAREVSPGWRAIARGRA